MLYLSQVLGRPILDLEGERVATLKDVIVRLGEEDHPPVAGFVSSYRLRDFFLPRWRISHFGEAGVRLNSDILDLRPFVRRAGEVLLARDVLDKQLVDVDGKRVVRVNDVQIIEAAGEWRVTGADVSLQGLWRRLAPAGFVGTRTPVEVIDWADVGYLATDAATVQLKSSSDKLARLHPVEIARLAQAFSYHHGTEIVAALDDDTAGGLMTTEFVTLPRDLTVGEALARLREMAETPNMIYYLYVTDGEGSWQLVGVIALRSLILADPSAPLAEVMRAEFQRAH